MFETKSSVGYVADILSNDLEEIFKFVAKTGHKNTLKSTLINITQTRFMMCASPFSSKLEKKFLHNFPETNTKISALQIQYRFKMERKVTILKVGNKTVVMKNAEDIALAETKVRRNIIDKRTQLRRIDCKTLLKLLEHLHTRCATDKRFLKSDDVVALRTDRYTVTDTKPRRVVRTEQEESVFPLKGDSFKNPLISRPVEEVVVGGEEEVQYPIQASDDAMDCMSSMSIAPSCQSMLSSQGEGSSQLRSSYLSGFATPVSNSRRSENSSIDSTSFNSAIARYDMYASSDRRRSTFQTPEWKVYEKPDIRDLVDQGFFFTSREDLVRCFMCGIGLKDWVRDDAVVKEHAKHSSKCAYLLQKIGKVEVDRIQAEISSSEPSSSLSWNQLPYKIRSPQYQRMDARLATFTSFPSRIHIPHQELAVAGLFFTGQGDLCRCFTCDGGLKDWTDGDDPCKEHATYFSHCEYINQLKGRDYVRTMQQRRQTKQQTGATGGGSQPAQYSSAMQAMERLDISSPDGSGMVFSQLKDMGYSDSDVLAASAELKKKGVSKPTAVDFVNTLLDMQEQRQAERAFRQTEGATASATNAPEDDLNALAEENERLAQMIQCMLCVDEEPDMLFLPCAHHRICHKCSTSINHCPVCGNFIKEKVRTYRA